MQLLENVRQAFSVPELRARIKFVFAMFAVFALGAHIPIPGLNVSGLQGQLDGGVLGMLDLFTGGSMKRMSLFALGIMPYITASIIMQLMGVAFPQVEQWQKEGEWGRRKIAQWTRYLTVAAAALQGFGLLSLFRSAGVLPDAAVLTKLRVVITMVAGTAFLLWLSEQITQKGIGNGVSLIIFAGIMLRLPQQLTQMFKLAGQDAGYLFSFVVLIAFLVATVYGVIYVQQAQRRIPVQYTRRGGGSRMTGASSYLPIQVNTAGVIPIIFAIAVAMFPAQIMQMVPVPRIAEVFGFDIQEWWGGASVWAQTFFSPTSSAFALAFYFLLVIAFTYFYTMIMYKPDDVADNLRKSGGLIPGIRPGGPTASYLDHVITRITLGGALFLGCIAIIEFVVPRFNKVGQGIQFDLMGGTSVLIVVMVALETMKQIESQLLVRQYDSFIR